MARRPNSGQCVHCGERFDKLTWDHVFPQSWYPDSTPRDIEKWKVPACNPCNKAYGRLEEDLRTRFGLCVEPEPPASSGIKEKVLRSLNPGGGRTFEDKNARSVRLQKIRRDIIPDQLLLPEAIYPGFGPRSDIPMSQQSALRISREDVNRLAEKFVRGLWWLIYKECIQTPYQIESYVLPANRATQVMDLLSKFGKRYGFGPGCTIEMALAREVDSHAAIFRIEIWGRLVIYASLTDPAHSPLKPHDRYKAT